MQKQHGLRLVLLTVLLLAELCGPPIRSQGVSAAPLATISTYINFTVLNAPPKRICLGNAAYFSVQYSIQKSRASAGGFTPVAPEPGEYTVYLSATNGTVSPSSAPLSNITGSGIIPATFKATQLGKGKITISAHNSAGATVYFQVVKCSWKVMIEADQRSVENPIKQFNKFQGEGGIDAEIDKVGGTANLTGSGTYRFIMTSQFVNLDPNLKCDDFSISTGDSTFSITHGTLLKNAVVFGIQLAEVDLPTSVVKCQDSQGHKFEAPANPPTHISDPGIPEFNKLVFPDGTTYLPFAFGDGKAGVYLIQRKGK